MLKKSRHIGLLFLALLLAGLSSCSDRLDDTNSPTRLIYDNYRVAFLIDTGDEYDGTDSRKLAESIDVAQSGDFVYGSHNEHTIGPNGNFVLFFNSSGQFHSHSLLNSSKDNLGDEFVSWEPNIEVYYTAKLKNLEDQLPLQCLIVLNADANVSTTITELKPVDNLESALKKLIATGSGNPFQIGFNIHNGVHYFTMSNSVFVDSDNKVRTTVEVSEENLQEVMTSDGISLPFDTTKVVHVQVERMMAKADFRIEPPTDNDVYDSSTKTFKPAKNEIVYCNGFDSDGNPLYIERHWKAQITGWGMNALEKKSYVIKNIRNTNYFEGWNAPDDYRCYWAEDLNYNSGNFPWQYRQAIDYDLIYYSKSPDDNPLMNYCYEDFQVPEELEEDEVQAYWDRTIYFPENTYDNQKYAGTVMDNRRDLLVGSHLIVTAILETDINPKLTDNSSNTEFGAYDVYRDRTGIWYSSLKHAMWNLVRNFNNLLESQDIMDFIYYDWNSSNPVKKTMKSLIRGHKYVLCYNGEPVTEYAHVENIFNNNSEVFIPAIVKDGDGRLVPYISGLSVIDLNNNNETLKVSDDIKVWHEDGETIFIRDNEHTATTDEMKSFLMEWLGVVDHFNKGKMYYSAPAKLSGLTGVDQFGVVRNNWYRFRLTNILNIGTSVDVTTDPIVPNIESTADQINLTVELKDWHDITTNAPLL